MSDITTSKFKAFLLNMAHSPLRNYATPGLTSRLIGGDGHGKVRMFTSDRDTRDWIAPHTHRYDFMCAVVSGEVENILFEKAPHLSWPKINEFAVCRVEPGKVIGEYDVKHVDTGHFYERSTVYKQGEMYAMQHDEFHSIRFSKGAQVLFFEGPEASKFSYMLEPWSDGARVETFASSAWMFKRD